jgi:hypothetical protein
VQLLLRHESRTIINRSPEFKSSVSTAYVDVTLEGKGFRVWAVGQLDPAFATWLRSGIARTGKFCGAIMSPAIENKPCVSRRYLRVRQGSPPQKSPSTLIAPRLHADRGACLLPFTVRSALELATQKTTIPDRTDPLL